MGNKCTGHLAISGLTGNSVNDQAFYVSFCLLSINIYKPNVSFQEYFVIFLILDKKLNFKMICKSE